MDALILAAGRGTRMAELTQQLPKPLLLVDDKSLIEHQIRRLRECGIHNIVINTAWLGSKIESSLGDGRQSGVRIRYSHESDGALETAGGIANALDLIESDPFIAVNGDVWVNQSFGELKMLSALDEQTGYDAHLVLVDNPSYHTNGDFFLTADGQVIDPVPGQEAMSTTARRLTFSGMGAYRKRLFDDLPERRYPLGPLLRQAMNRQRVGGEHFKGLWISVDTRERLQTVRQWQKNSHNGADGTDED